MVEKKSIKLEIYNMAEHNSANPIEKYIHNVVALKIRIDSYELCQCFTLYNLTGRCVHQRECVVGLCKTTWAKAEQLLNLVSYVYVQGYFSRLWELKALSKKQEDLVVVLDYLKDFVRFMTTFCRAAQSFFVGNPCVFYSSTIEHLDELLMLDNIPLEFYRRIASDDLYQH